MRTSVLQLGFQNRRPFASTIVENFSVLLTEISLDKTTHRTGFGAAAPAIFDVPLRGASGTLVALVGIDDAAGTNGSAEVIVKIDDSVAAKSPVLRGGGAPYELRVPIDPGSKTLTFEIVGSGDGFNYDFVDIVSPEIHLQGRR
jgi:hypothetical protein